MGKSKKIGRERERGEGGRARRSGERKEIKMKSLGKKEKEGANEEEIEREVERI